MKCNKCNFEDAWLIDLIKIIFLRDKKDSK